MLHVLSRLRTGGRLLITCAVSSVCACVYERERREGGRKGERERERGGGKGRQRGRETLTQSIRRVEFAKANYKKSAPLDIFNHSQSGTRQESKPISPINMKDAPGNTVGLLFHYLKKFEFAFNEHHNMKVFFSLLCSCRIHFLLRSRYWTAILLLLCSTYV